MATLPRVVVVEDGESYDVLEVIEASEMVVRARVPFWFEVGEELKLRIEHDGQVREAVWRVRGHAAVERILELEVTELEDSQVVAGK
jgi:hypothetical protein